MHADILQHVYSVITRHEWQLAFTIRRVARRFAALPLPAALLTTESIEGCTVHLFLAGDRELLHRDEKEGPAIDAGGRVWNMFDVFRNTECHNFDFFERSRGWFRMGKLHRKDGPAIKQDDGEKSWWIDGVLHREDGPALISSCCTRWVQHGKLHREDGPAFVRSDGAKEWWRNGVLHRTDGPAIEWANGTEEWWIDGEKTYK